MTVFLSRPRLVLFDRDGTLVVDVPYNGDPEQVQPMPGAVDAVKRIRDSGCGVGVVTNQSGIGREYVTADEVARVNLRVDELFGGFDTWQVCPHVAEDGCRCRKPRPGMVLEAAWQLAIPPSEVVVIGDIGADVQAARAAGAAAILIPTRVTRLNEIDEAPVVLANLLEAATLIESASTGVSRRGAA